MDPFSTFWPGLSDLSKSYYESDPSSLWATYVRGLGQPGNAYTKWLSNAYGPAYADYTAYQASHPNEQGLWGDFVQRNQSQYQNEYNLLPQSQRGDYDMWNRPPGRALW